MAERYLTKPLVDLPKRQLSSIEQKLAGSYAKPENQFDLGTILRELDPTYTIPRGMDTLSNVDYGALKDMLLGKYQISKNPRQDLERAGQAALGTVEGIADVSPLALGIKPAIKAVKSLAPEMATMAERYSLDPNMYIVPPEGNLNFTSSITRDKLKGPEKQMVGNFIGQAKNIPGVTKEGLEEAILKSEQLRDPTTVLTKEQFENALPASQYNKVDLGAALADEDVLDDLRQHFMDQAIEYVDPMDVYHRRSIPNQYMEIVDALAMGELNFSSLTPRAKKDLSSIFSLDESMPDSHIQDIIDMDLRSTHFEMADEIAMDLARDEMDANPGTYYSTDGQPTYAFKRIQRLVPEETEGYFGIGLTHPEHEGWYKHYSNAPKNTIGHVRGTITKEPVEIAGGVIVPENSAIIEEIQSDVQQKMAQKGPLKQVHGALFKAAVQHALEKGANRIYLPSAKTIANPLTNDRGIENLPLYQRIYDDEVIKQGLKPLSEIPGVKVTPIETIEQPTRGLRPGYKPTFYDTPNEASKVTMQQLGVPDEIRDEMHVMTLFRPQAVSDKVAAWLRSKNLTPEQFFNMYKEVNKNNLAELTAKHEALLEQEKLDNTIDIPARKVLLYNVIDIDPEAAEYILKGPGQTTPGYAMGGMVAGGIVGFDKGGKADESDNKMELQEYIKQEDLKTLIEELARRVNLSGEALQTKEGSQAFGRLDFRQPLSEDMDLGLGASGHYVKGKHFKDSGLDRADIALSKRLKNDSELRARLGANLNENMGKRGIDELMLEYTIPFKEGGKADKEEYSMPEKINRYVRQSQFKAADLVGLGPEVDFATTIPERYYPADEQHMGRGDAMRHLLLQAQLYKKYGELPAKTIGFLHEMLGGGQTDAEEAMDKYNDILGREIGKASKDRYDMVKRAMEAIENKKARVMTEAEKRESGYAEGGLVYNDDLINQLAEDLFGVK